MNDAGVSPVVGTVLMIAIMLVTVGVLLQWGVPALQALEQRSQYRSARSAMVVLDGVIDETLPETGASRQAKIPVREGGVFLSPQADPFAVAWSYSDAATFDDLADDDPDVDFSTGASVATCRFRHYDAQGVLTGTESVSPSSGTCTANQDLDTTHALELRDSAGDAVANVWIFHPGRIRYEATPAAGRIRLDYHNGAVATDFQGGPFLVDDPLILKLEPTGMTVGLIDLTGDASSASGETARVQATLAQSAVRADVATAERVDLYPLGAMSEGWLRYLNTTGRYDLAWPSGADHVRYEPGGTLPVTLTHYVVEAEVRGVV